MIAQVPVRDVAESVVFVVKELHLVWLAPMLVVSGLILYAWYRWTRVLEARAGSKGQRGS